MASRPPGRPPRAVPRAAVPLRLEPELLARLDAWNVELTAPAYGLHGEIIGKHTAPMGRNAKIVALIEAGLPRLADE